MFILKCKMCGGNLNVEENVTVCECEYCGSMQTIPRIESEKKARLFNRAHQYRMNNEFDKAYDAYKSIVDEDEQEAEAYWGMLLAEYGIEYVTDPKTQKKIPTCHRTKVQSILNNTNYKLARQYAEAENKLMYQDEAEVIDSLQKRILSVASQEKPYDVFICYKETEDESGERTKDSVLAQEIYDELEREGLRVFFSRITLEDKLGTEYEPYIYAALSSARLMLMATTDTEHCNAVWVKNEWTRYLQMMEDDASKTFIPVYQGISAYELPHEFAKYQAQDMGKVGAKQDLVRGVKKVLGKAQNGALNANERQVLQGLASKKAKQEQIQKQFIKFVPYVVYGIAAVVTLFCLIFFKSKFDIVPASRKIYLAVSGFSCMKLSPLGLLAMVGFVGCCILNVVGMVFLVLKKYKWVPLCHLVSIVGTFVFTVVLYISRVFIHMPLVYCVCAIVMLVLAIYLQKTAIFKNSKSGFVFICIVACLLLSAYVSHNVLPARNLKKRANCLSGTVTGEVLENYDFKDTKFADAENLKIDLLKIKKNNQGYVFFEVDIAGVRGYVYGGDVKILCNDAIGELVSASGDKSRVRIGENFYLQRILKQGGVNYLGFCNESNYSVIISIL